ncbi:MAG: hypothetical protein U9Q81_06965, partial [Pseudomonadota bacterium]|nr:hypothetical protein [Pseudomonadota bacterium]
PRSGIGEVFSVADWKVVDWRMVTDYKLPGSVEGQDPAIALFFDVERLHGYYWVKIIAPLVLIVAMSWAVFWIDPKEMGTKISITITAMLTLIAYRFAIGANLPVISYLTLLDYFIMVSTLLIYASLVTVVTTAAFERKGNFKLAKRIDRVSRWSFPLFFILSWGVIMLSA